MTFGSGKSHLTPAASSVAAAIRSLLRCSFSLSDQFQYFLIAWMVSESVEVGVVLDPLVKLRTNTREQTFEQVKSGLNVAQTGVAARHIILSPGIVGVDG